MTPISLDTITQAIEILGVSEITDETINFRMAKIAIDPLAARRLIDWIPEAFGAVAVSHMGKVILPKRFFAMNAKGRVKSFRLSREPVFGTAVEIANQMVRDGRDKAFQNIALRSSFVKSANKAILSGLKTFDGAAFGPPALLGICAETYQNSIESFLNSWL